ncbi:MAG: polyribonucleotide nucleotidyltransferase [Candidatus Liptonbacteria bacterium]|nr:polyribonucleotide nucleotidyltransferase [Candidatus Liptonbacteria bacterium]
MKLEKKQFSAEVNGKTLTLEISPLAGQANSAVLAKYGETAVLVTVVMSKRDEGVDYLPLKVDYEEKFYAAGKIIGSRFIRREGRPSEEAILAGRLVDRAIRPLFDQRVRREIQVVVTVLAFDEENEPDFVGLIAASTALGISDVPWNGPISGVRIAKVGKEFLVNPNNSDLAKPDFVFETFAAGRDGKINMIELAGKEASEEDVLKAWTYAAEEIDKLINFQESIVQEVGKPKAEIALAEVEAELRAEALKFLASRLEEAVYESSKSGFQEKLADLRKSYFEHLQAKFENLNYKAAEFLFEEAIDELVHKNILEKEKRPDGRRLDEVRELYAEVGIFERTHGSALFIRGNTQALAVTTLAPPGAEQLIETMERTATRRFLLHYNFPPYSVGEIGSFRGPGRREIGHGALAEKGLRSLIPSQEQFPYTIRVVSEILSSNGSSSMATVCASSLSLFDAGVPLAKLAAGIAMGMMAGESGKYKILTDIQGPEDHHGDMDLKAAGTKDGLTAIQMDVKIEGLTMEMLQETLKQAKKARLEILKLMESVIHSPRPEISVYAPNIAQLRVNPEKLGAVIGPGGKMIKGLIKKYELIGIDVEDDGRVFVSGSKRDKMDSAVEEIKAITRDFKVGEVIEGTVIKILDFGAIVDLGGGKDGMIHVSELKDGFVKNVSDVLKVGDFVKAKIVRADEDGRIGLSIKQL